MNYSTNLISGINIQWPWSELIISGQKTIETRSYALPQKHLGKPLALIETPGKKGKKAGVKEARIIGIVIFSQSYQYSNKEHWIKDKKHHLVSENDINFSFHSDKEKWAWVIQSIKKFPSPKKAPAKKGIVFANNCKV